MAGSTTPDQMVNLLWEFGPCAFFVFMFMVGLRIARQRAGTPEQQKVQNVAFSVVWLSIFVFAGLSVVVFWKVNFPPEQCIHGFIRGLQDPTEISTRDNIFLKKLYGANKDYDLEFRIVNPDKDAKYVGLELQTSPDGLHAATYRIPLEKCDRKGKIPVEYMYERGSGKLLTQGPGATQTLMPQMEDAVVGETQRTESGRGIFSLPVVHAAMASDTASLVRALDANDPVIRSNARQQLAADGSSLRALQAALQSGSLRTQFEAVRTLNAMRGVDGNSFPQPARCAVLHLQGNPDAGVRSEAGRLVASVGRGWRC